MHVLITGSSGLIGSALSAHLVSASHQVTHLVRREPGSGEKQWDPAAGTFDPDVLVGVDAVVNLAGAGIGDRRWTDDYKREIVDSRVKTTELLADAVALMDQPPLLLSGSAIGIYGDRGDEQITESSSPGTDFLADLCVRWEAATTTAAAAGARVVHLRTGIVLSPEGGALRKQLPLFRLGLGGKMGPGTSWQSWISIDDEVGAITFLLTDPRATAISGAVNLTAPEPVVNAEFARVLGRVLKRPAVMRVPAIGPRLVLGRELADTLLFTGQRVTSEVLQAAGYGFRHPDLETALRHLLERP